MDFKSTLNLVQLLTFLRKAQTPEDVFDYFPKKSLDEMAVDAKAAYHRFTKVGHPDHYADPSEKRMATETQSILNELWARAEERFKNGTYGKDEPDPESAKPVVFKTAKNQYTILERVYSGGTAGLFHAVVTDKKGVSTPALLKVPHSAQDNDLMEREAKAYGLFKAKLKEISTDDEGKKIARLFGLRAPHLIESLCLTEGGSKVKKTVNAFLVEPKFQSGWYTLEDIRTAFPSGVDPRIAVFIINRILESLTFAHAAGVLHRAVTPNHVLIHAESHMGQLVDWTASRAMNLSDKIPYMDKKYADFFAPEIAIDGAVRSSDIYMAAMCGVHILGGDLKSGLPTTVPESIRVFLNKCLQPRPARRPHSAETAYQEFRKVAEGLYGPRKFIEFTMPVA